MWSPKRNNGGRYNPYYENMRGISPGDIVYAFSASKIKAVGIAKSYAFSYPKPEEFGAIGPNWHPTAGWKVLVKFINLEHQITPAGHIQILRPLLPAKHSPLQDSGRGNQAYLFEISQHLAQVLAGLIGEEASVLIQSRPGVADTATQVPLDDRQGLDIWEERLQDQIRANAQIQSTEKEALIKSRRGQGIYRQRLMRVEYCCRITKVANPTHLVGSHIKPWREANNDERLDGENGLLLTPSMDHLFDRGFISFKDSGDLIVSSVADLDSLVKMGIPYGQDFNAGEFTNNQRHYLEFHRDSILLNRRQA